MNVIIINLATEAQTIELCSALIRDNASFSVERTASGWKVTVEK